MDAEKPRTIALGEVVSLTTGRLWSDVFHRSRLSPFVFVVAADNAGDVISLVKDLGLPEAESVHMYSSAYWAWPLLDGAVTRLSTYGLPLLPGAVRVFGYEPMRLLCHLLGLKAPARALKGERTVRSSDQLLADLEKERHRDRDELLRQARLAMVADTSEVMWAVRSFFGDDAVEFSNLDEHVMPGRGAWGDAGFSRAEASELERSGVPAREATAWRELVNANQVIGPMHPIEDIVRGRAYEFDELRRWIGAGADLAGALALLDSGRSFEEAEPYLRAGASEGYINKYIKIGLTPEQYADYQALGIGDFEVARFAVEDIVRVRAYGLDELRRWIDASAGYLTSGAYLTGALALLDSGRSFEEAEPYLRAGAQPTYINRYIEIGLTPEQYADYKALGIDGIDAARFAFTGITPEAAVRWREVGADGWGAWVIVSTGGSLADWRKMAAAGESIYGYARARLKVDDEYPEIMSEATRIVMELR